MFIFTISTDKPSITALSIECLHVVIFKHCAVSGFICTYTVVLWWIGTCGLGAEDLFANGSGWTFYLATLLRIVVSFCAVTVQRLSPTLREYQCIIGGISKPRRRIIPESNIHFFKQHNSDSLYSGPIKRSLFSKILLHCITDPSFVLSLEHALRAISAVEKRPPQCTI